MAQTASTGLFTHAWQDAGASHRVSSSESVRTERLRSILQVDAETIEKKVAAPNRSADDQICTEPVFGEGTRRLIASGLLPDILPDTTTEGKLDRFILLQKWEGTVTRCPGEEFTAVLREKGQPDQEATFDIEEVPEGDRCLIVVGAIFQWSIGYRDRRGQRIRESIIRFRRLPAWNKREIERARQEADEIIAALHWGEFETTR
jgi:hypothetical protein